MRLANKTALITGGASGIGAAATQRFIEEGCQVMICDIQAEAGKAFASSLGERAAFMVCDVTKEDDVGAAALTVMNSWSSADALSTSPKG